jgi:lysozyme
MKLSPRAFELLQTYVHYRPSAYEESPGCYCIGFGHSDGVCMGDTITRPEAVALFRNDVSKVENKLNSQNLNLKQSQFDSLVMLHYSFFHDTIPVYKYI